MSLQHKLELLAPAGGQEALRAAVQNGANAVYLGGKLFNARQNAHNFSREELAQVVRYAHLNGVRVYVTVNTLLDNSEIPEMIEYLYSLTEQHIDALIVQDLGVAQLVRSLLPEMELHASTQMTIHNSAGVRFLEKMGFSRVVLAREVSLENIRLIKGVSKLPLEAFVHGALCVCYSGQCLMSSMIGGRSGNRGRCAQPCRMDYTLVNQKGDEIKEGYLLSPRDLKMIENLPLLAEAGITAFKVEGRMKRPEYVATVVRHYRNALDDVYGNPLKYQGGKQAHKELVQIFNRDFTTGYYLMKPGPHLMGYQRPNNRGMKLGRVTAFDPKSREVTVSLDEPVRIGDGYEIWVTRGGRIAGEIKSLRQEKRTVERAERGEVTFPLSEGTAHIGDRVFKTMDLDLMKKAQDTFLSPAGQRKKPLDFTIRYQEGEPLTLSVRDEEGHVATVTGRYRAEKAQKHPASREILQKQLGRLGNTIFYLRDLSIEGEAGLLVPLSELNNLRREAVEKIEKLLLDKFALPLPAKELYYRRADDLLRQIPKMQNAAPNRILSVLVGDLLSLRAALEAGGKTIYFGGDRLRRKSGIRPLLFRQAVEECHKFGARAVLLGPRLYHEEQAAEVSEYFWQGAEAGVDGFLLGNIGTIQLAQELHLAGLRGDYTLNIFNDLTIKTLLDAGLEQLTLSPELTLEQIGRLHFLGEASLECLVHGSLPLMITEQCTIGNVLGKGHLANGCLQPCKKEAYGLKDRMNMIFPLECDENCRMLVFNPKTLCLADRLTGLLKTGVRTLRIEARKEEPYWVKKVVQVYRQELDRYQELGPEKYKVRDGSKELLSQLSPAGFTAGHYFRGVE